MSSSPPELDVEHATRAIKVVTEMTHEEAGATDEEAFDIGKTIGIHLSEATKACRNFVFIDERLKKRSEQIAKLMDFIFKLQSPNANKPSLDSVMDILQEMVDADGKSLYGIVRSREY